MVWWVYCIRYKIKNIIVWVYEIWNALLWMCKMKKKNHVKKCLPSLLPETRCSQRKRSRRSCSPGFQDHKNPEMFHTQFSSIGSYYCHMSECILPMSTQMYINVDLFACFQVVSIVIVLLAPTGALYITMCDYRSAATFSVFTQPIVIFFHLCAPRFLQITTK